MYNNVKPFQEEGVFKQASPWLVAARNQLQDPKLPVLAECRRGGFNFLVKNSNDTLWVIIHWSKGGGAAFRTAYCPAGGLVIKEIQKNDKCTLCFVLDSNLGPIKTQIEFPEDEQPLLHWTTTLKTLYPLFFEAWPRDIYPLDEKNDPLAAKGVVYSKQEGPKAGIIYLTLDEPRSGSLLYMQNFTVLNDYFEKTHSTPTTVVQGLWPELGFSLPKDQQKPLPANTETIISDAFILPSLVVPKDEYEAAQLYLDLQIPIYFHLKRPGSNFHDYVSKAEQSIKDLEHAKACSICIKGQQYLLPYVDAKEKPPESMVQLAVLVSLAEFEQWQEKSISMCAVLRRTIGKFYDSDLKTIKRYLPGVRFNMECKEPQENPDVMDAWYLFHPLLNLARLARRGFADARKVFFDSLDYAINTARYYDYRWPVLYNMKTLEIIQNQPQGVGETDVGCIYALVMVHAYELSNDKRYLEEAKKAAKSLDGLGFNLPYQMNVTAFGLSAFWRLYKITSNELYKKKAILCIANIFSNSWLWECKYGYAKNYTTFIGIAPLAKMHDNNYLASYEELEVLSAFDDLFDISDESEVSPSIRLLLSEYTRYVLDRCWSYFPSELPQEMLAEKSKTGKINPKLAFPLEDLREGWQKAGQVGQEVYGAGAVFTTVTRHFNHKKEWPFTIFCEYPTAKFSFKQDKDISSIKFHVIGDNRLQCQLRILPFKHRKLPESQVFFSQNNDEPTELKSHPAKDGYPYYVVKGGTDIVVTWKTSRHRR